MYTETGGATAFLPMFVQICGHRRLKRKPGKTKRIFSLMIAAGHRQKPAILMGEP
jgi:hypothetical protein